jgi:pimeloyl-ACP methyl ester carboxylesterase
MDAGTVPEAVAILLPGGMESSYSPVGPLQPAYLRMAQFALSLHRWGAGRGLSVWQIRYRYRGWNAEDMSPLDDGLYALEQVRRRHGSLPVALVGHSMGGRTALRLAGDQSVCGVLGLAPWLPAGEPTAQLARRKVILAHGTRDRLLRPQHTVAYAERALAREGRATNSPELLKVVMVRGGGHMLVLRPLAWDRLVRESLAVLLDGVW